MKKYISLVLLFLVSVLSYSQSNYWQQEIGLYYGNWHGCEYNQFKGVQKLVYINNSPDTLHHVFYHLYFNAFQPGSMMDVRSRSIQDPDPRVGSRIEGLKDDEIGFQKIDKLTQDGKKLKFELVGTI